MRRILSLVAFGVLAFATALQAGKAEVLINASPCEGLLGPQLILRQDFTDIPILGCTSGPGGGTGPLKTAVGSRASYTYDDIRHASALGADGLAALNFQYTRGEFADYLSTISFGPFAQGAGTHVFATPSAPASTSGAVTSGAFVQFFLEQPLPFALRLRGGELVDSTGVHDGVAVGELIPTFRLRDLFGTNLLPERLGFFAFGSEYQLDNGLKTIVSPELEAQYDSYQSGPLAYALFATHHEAMRVGPLIVVKLYGFENLTEPDSPLHKQFARIAISAAYHADLDTFSNRRYYSFQPALIYNLDDKGNFAVTASYSLGDSESSGNRSRQLKAAISAKF